MDELGDQSQPTRVFIARNPAEAHHAKGLLEADGIVAEIRGEALFSAQGEIPIGESMPTVWVLEGDAQRARALLKDYHSDSDHSGGDERSWECAKCGEVLEAQFTACWSCGTERSDL